MRRTEIRLKRTAQGIFYCHPRTGAWHLTKLSPDLKIATGPIADLRTLMLEFMSAQDDFYQAQDWPLRITKQREIGASLCRSVFGPTFDIDPQSWLHFVPDAAGGSDFVNFISRVPWMLLTKGAQALPSFLAQDGLEPVAITVDACPQPKPGLDYDILMPRAPRLLMVLPEVRGPKSTGARLHGENIRARLIAEYEKHGDVGDIRSVRTLDDFQHEIEIERFNPQIIYFYGHATTSGAGTMFEFERDGKGDRYDVGAIAAMIGKVVSVTGTPPLIWFNACLGAAADDESALQVFAEIASCVIAMRTVVRATHSRQLAEQALSAIIVDGQSPHVALRDTLSVVRPDWMGAGHWAASVVACQYSGWTALGREQDPGYAESDDAVGDFPARLDRWDPLATLEARIRDGLNAPMPPGQPVTLFWYGPASQLPDQFEKRVRDRVLEKFPHRRPIVLKVELQPDVRLSPKEDLSNDFRVAILRGLQRNAAPITAHVDDNRLVTLFRELAPGQDSILVFLHGPLQGTDTAMVESYIELWRDLADSLGVRPGSPRIVLAFGFVASSIDVRSDDGQPPVRLDSVAPADIHEHLMRYHTYYNLSPRKVPDEARRIYEASGGQLRKLLRALRQMAKL